LVESSLADSEAPTGAKSNVSGTIKIKPIRITNPNVPAGISVGRLPSSSIINAPGKDMIRPIAAAIPTALWAG
jgi:hypothetical protein